MHLARRHDVEDESRASLRPADFRTPEPGLVAPEARGHHGHTATLPSRGTPLRSPHDGCLDRPPAPPAPPGPPDPRTTPTAQIRLTGQIPGRLARPIRVMQTFGEPRDTTNPYLVMLRAALIEEPSVEHIPVLVAYGADRELRRAARPLARRAPGRHATGGRGPASGPPSRA